MAGINPAMTTILALVSLRTEPLYILLYFNLMMYTSQPQEGLFV
jgi:hypothetical protein